MALISLPKQLIDNYRKSSANRMDSSASDIEKRGLQSIVDDPGMAILAVLRPYLKGDLLHLTMMYTYGDIEVVDENDGYYRLEIPDNYLSEKLPVDFGSVLTPQEKSKNYPEEVRGKLLTDLTVLVAPIFLQIKDRLLVQPLLESCSQSFSRVLGSNIDERTIMTQLASILRPGQRSIGPNEILNAADQISNHLDDADKIDLATSMMKIFGVNPQTKENEMAAMIFKMCCMGLGVLFDSESGNVTIDPAGTLKKIAFKMNQNEVM